MRFVAILLIFLLSFTSSISQELTKQSEKQREFYNFYWGVKIPGPYVYPSKVLYDLLTNEIIGDMENKDFSYYYIEEGSTHPKLKATYKEIISYCYKFKTYENAIRWINGERFITLKKKEKNKEKENIGWAHNDNYARPNELVDTKLFGVYLPNLNSLVEYVKNNKNEIYGLRDDYLKSIKGTKIDSLGFTIYNLVSEYIYSDTSKKLITSPESKDTIFYKIYSYMYKGLNPFNSKHNAIGYNNLGKTRDDLRHVYFKEVNLFVVLQQNKIMVFDPFFGPLYFKKSPDGFKLYDKQKESVKLVFNKNSEFYQYTSKNNNNNTLPIYFVDNGSSPKRDSIGLEFRIQTSSTIELDFFDITTFTEGPISTLPAYGYNKIRYFKINNVDFYIGTNLFFKNFIDTVDIPTTFQQRQIMYQAGRISQNQLFNPNLTLRDIKVRRGLSGEKEEIILNSYGYAVTPFFDEVYQVSNSFFRIKKDNKYGLICISPETIRENKIVLLNNIYDTILWEKEGERLTFTGSYSINGKLVKESYTYNTSDKL
jgi:hypothetical protein